MCGGETPPASSEGPQANMGPMADAVETEEGPRFVRLQSQPK